jgi:hypothetical protein
MLSPPELHFCSMMFDLRATFSPNIEPSWLLWRSRENERP